MFTRRQVCKLQNNYDRYKNVKGIILARQNCITNEPVKAEVVEDSITE